MSAKHTPGPWLAEGGKVFADTGRLFDRAVAIVGVPLDKNDNLFGELEANARLIAAAPDLLEAAQWVIDNPGAHQNNVRAVLCKAIEKAAGQKGGS